MPLAYFAELGGAMLNVSGVTQELDDMFRRVSTHGCAPAGCDASPLKW
jgi:hypothetical protein